MDFSRLTEYIDSLEGEYGIPGCDMAVWKAHQPVYRHCAGCSDYAHETPVSPGDAYNIYSATKLATCTAGLQLIERGVISMDSSAAYYLPAFEHACVREKEGLIPCKTPLTIHQLFTMTGGMNYDPQPELVKKALETGKTGTLDIVSAMADIPLDFQPGTHFKYSYCHDVLGGVIEAASGMKLRDYMRQNIFGPLGMEHTTFEPVKTSAQYEFTEAGIIRKDGNAFRITPDYDSGGAGLVSTVDDYIKLIDMLACDGVGQNGKRVLTAGSVWFMRQNQLTGERLREFQLFRPHYGYGLGVRTLLDKSASKGPLGEFGWDGAAGLYALADPINHVAAIFAMHVLNYGRVYDEAHPTLRDLMYEALGLAE